MGRLISIALVVIVLIAGWSYFSGKKTAVAPTTEDNSLSAVDPQTEKSGGLVNSIKDAMGLGQKMRCTYSAKDASGVVSTIFVDGQKYKFTSETNGEQVNGIFDGTTQYVWTSGKQKQGWMMTKACLEEISKLSPQAAENSTKTETPQDMEKSFDTAQNVQCSPAASEDFSIPTDINFVDQCAMMKKALEGMKNLPAGVKIPGY